jgi:AcrR family transcriptional regulator
MSSTTATRRRPGGRSARVRSQVLAAATELLADTGFERLSFEAVAERAGVHKTTVYRRWPTKAELVLDALHARSDLVIELPDSGRLDADLLAFLHTVVANVTSPMGRALVLATMQTDGESAESAALRQRFWQERFDRLRSRLERAGQAGQLEAGTDVDLLVERLISPIFFRAFIRGGTLDDEFLSALVDELGVRPPRR